MDLAEDFISAFSDGKPYISIHWRYNKKDFMRRLVVLGVGNWILFRTAVQ